MSRSNYALIVTDAKDGDTFPAAGNNSEKVWADGESASGESRQQATGVLAAKPEPASGAKLAASRVNIKEIWQEVKGAKQV